MYTYIIFYIYLFHTHIILQDGYKLRVRTIRRDNTCREERCLKWKQGRQFWKIRSSSMSLHRSVFNVKVQGDNFLKLKNCYIFIIWEERWLIYRAILIWGIYRNGTHWDFTSSIAKQIFGGFHSNFHRRYLWEWQGLRHISKERELY